MHASTRLKTLPLALMGLLHWQHCAFWAIPQCMIQACNLRQRKQAVLICPTFGRTNQEGVGVQTHAGVLLSRQRVDIQHDQLPLLLRQVLRDAQHLR
jgi:hypothetical protein